MSQAAANPILFGANVDPSTHDPQEPFRRARAAEQGGLDLITLQDHPYIGQFFDTWTLLASLAMRTERIHLGTNVANLPLRSPAMLAKMAATLDVLSGGRVELGIGAGANPKGVAGLGGPARAAGEAYGGLADALHIIRGMWEHSGGEFTYEGRIYQVRGVQPGPAPAHRIRLWTGVYGPRALRLTGRLADGILITNTYAPPERLPEMNARIDAGARHAGRDPLAVRRGYNVMGVLDLGRPDTRAEAARPGLILGPVAHWVEQVVRLHREYRQDTFIFWPVSGNELIQIEAFAREVVPGVRAALG